MPALSAFSPQPQEAGLDTGGQQALNDLKIQTLKKQLQAHLAKASEKLSESAGALNDRAGDKKIICDKQHARQRENGEEIDEDTWNENEQYQEKVDTLTKKMDQAVRRAVDNNAWAHKLQTALQQVFTSSSNVSQDAQLQRHRAEQATRRQREASQAAEDGIQAPTQALDDRDDDDVPIFQPDHSETPSALFLEAIAAQRSEWNAQTLTERYSKDKDYMRYYRTIFDAKNPGEDAPPLPPADFWFAQEEGRQVFLPRTQAANGAEDEDSDLEVASERVRTTCPLTLVPFEDPWKSTKCPHNFEKSAIFDMINNANTYVQWTPQQLVELSRSRDRRDRERREKEIGTPQIQCPECTVKLTAVDLEPNPMLQRRVKRILEKERREAEAAEEEDSSEDDAPRGTQRRPVGLGSSPPRRLKAEMVKRENAAREREVSMVPGTQFPGGTQTTTAEGGTVIELEDDEDEEMAED